ncbi:MAG: DNA alkylation repair protein [SAR324 cluster bacterium]|nr:DNA alkylation repair protein [SAR324 cluster bacterium]
MDSFLEFIRHVLEEQADPEISRGMGAYMKTNQKCYGVKAPERRQIFRKARLRFPVKTFDEYRELILALWQGESREEMYMALDVAEYYKKFQTNDAMDLYEKLLETATNWDLVDPIAGSLVSRLVMKNRAHEARLQQWLHSENFWFRRSALLAHLRHQDTTNVSLMEYSIIQLMHEKEFFIRKAIGWVLRGYSYVDPEWVQAFVKQHENELSGLSKREALKAIHRKASRL